MASFPSKPNTRHATTETQNSRPVWYQISKLEVIDLTGSDDEDDINRPPAFAHASSSLQSKRNSANLIKNSKLPRPIDCYASVVYPVAPLEIETSFQDVVSKKLPISTLHSGSIHLFQDQIDTIRRARKGVHQDKNYMTISNQDVNIDDQIRNILFGDLTEQHRGESNELNIDGQSISFKEAQSVPATVQPTLTFKSPSLSLEERKRLVLETFGKLVPYPDARMDHGPTNAPIASIARALPVQTANLSGNQHREDRLPRAFSSPSPQAHYGDVVQEAASSRVLGIPPVENVLRNQIRSRRVTRNTSSSSTLPYLSNAERDQIGNTLAILDTEAFKGRISSNTNRIHVPMSQEEIQIIISVIRDKRQLHINTNGGIAQLKDLLMTLASKWIISRRIGPWVKELDGVQINRTTHSIVSFLEDVISNKVEAKRWKILPALVTRDKTRSMALNILGREMSMFQCNRRLENDMYATMGPTLRFNQMSGDVNCLAFSPNGNHFAVGGVCFEDEQSQAYNDSGNLILGDIDLKTVHELPDHYVPRQKTSSGPNSTEDMFQTQDRRLWKSISGVGFNQNGRHLLSAGWDSKLRIYDLDKGSHVTRDLGANVDVLSVSKHANLAATGTSKDAQNISIWRFGDERADLVKEFDQNSPLLAYSKNRYFPSSLAWGLEGNNRHLLVAGFSERQDDDRRDVKGHVCLWDANHDAFHSILPHSHAVFTTAWSPTNDLLASATTGQFLRDRRHSRTQIRVYHRVSEANWKIQQTVFDCPALDINDVVFCPYESMYVAVGATDGCVYVYDRRNYNAILHELRHSAPIIESQPGERETWDVGIRFCSWNQSRTGLVTGGSDGVVKVWDIFRSTEDAHRSDIVHLQSGIMAGAYNSDFTRLVIGEVNRSFTSFEVGKDDNALKSTRPFRYVRKLNNPSTQPDSQIRGTSFPAPPVPKSNVLPWCNIPLCKHVFSRSNKVMEILHDSNRSFDRIPASLLNSKTSANGAVPLMSCQHCGAPCRVADEEDEDQFLFPLCEKCGFSCLRCGSRIKLGSKMEFLKCKNCNIEWSIGTLGYDVQATGTVDVTMEDVQDKAEDDSDEEEEENDEEEGLLDSYHDLWGCGPKV